jgi:plasmid stability protein
MADLLIRNIDPELKRLIAELAAKSGCSMSAEADFE